jgi:hypothetical protein
MTSPFAHISPILIFFTCFGLTGVGACFIVGMPVVGQLLVGMWTTVMGERVVSELNGKESGTTLSED